MVEQDLTSHSTQYLASIGSGWSAWSKGRRPPGAACYIRQMNRVNSHSGNVTMP